MDPRARKLVKELVESLDVEEFVTDVKAMPIPEFEIIEEKVLGVCSCGANKLFSSASQP